LKYDIAQVMNKKLFQYSLTFLIINIIVSACNFPSERIIPTEPTSIVRASPTGTVFSAPVKPTATLAAARTATAEPAPMPSVTVNRIGIRMVANNAEFFDTVTREKFIPRGTNYIDFVERIPGKMWEDYIFGAGTYQPEKVRSAFRRLSAGGYNTVRLFFDHCFSGPSCIGNQKGEGLNPVFLDNIVEVMHLAGEEGLYLVLTANGVPLGGGYWTRFGEQYERDPHPGFGEDFYENGYYLHAAGVDMQAQYWRDLMTGLAEREAPFEVVLGWQLQNEYWLFKNSPPLSLNEGLVTISNGQTYDLADAEQKRQMVTDGVLFWMETLIPIIKEYDPEGLVTVGFFPPDFPNPTGLVTDWYRDTASLIEIALVDFWDFHAYPEPQTFVVRNMQNTAENFGMVGYQQKPVIMGEYGAFREIYPSPEVATYRLQEWMAESCEFGFDGWLTWEYYNRPASDAVWGLENEALFEALAPINQPDPCAMVPLPLSNLAFGKPVMASRSLPNEPPENAVDGGDTIWGAGADAPQWIEIDLGEAVPINEIRLWVAQHPAGETIHQIRVRDTNGHLTEIHRFSQFTSGGEWLILKLETPVENVISVRVDTLKSPSWVAWAEIEVYGE
jgi:hypothetical protein